MFSLGALMVVLKCHAVPAFAVHCNAVGVAKNSKYNSLDEKTPPLAFIPLLQEPFPDNPARAQSKRPYVYCSELNVCVARDPNALAQSSRRAIAEIDSRIPVFSVSSHVATSR
jgi:hypothetical protein